MKKLFKTEKKTRIYLITGRDFIWDYNLKDTLKYIENKKWFLTRSNKAYKTDKIVWMEEIDY